MVMEVAMKLLQHNGEIANEIRPAYFLKAFNRKIEDMQIVSFGQCNFRCPYCKRDGQFRNTDDSIVNSVDVSLNELTKQLKSENRIRLSGGDPCVFIKESLEVANFVKSEHSKKISIAHNGSSFEFIKAIYPFLEYAAIDIKAAHSKEFSLRTDVNEQLSRKYRRNTMFIIEFLASHSILIDARTVIFRDTSLDSMMKIAEFCNQYNENVFLTFRQYKKVAGIDWKSMKKDLLVYYIDYIANEFKNLRIGLRAKWEPEGFKYWNIRK